MRGLLSDTEDSIVRETQEKKYYCLLLNVIIVRSRKELHKPGFNSVLTSTPSCSRDVNVRDVRRVSMYLCEAASFLHSYRIHLYEYLRVFIAVRGP